LVRLGGVRGPTVGRITTRIVINRLYYPCKM